MDKSRASCRSAFLIAAAVALAFGAPAKADGWQSGEPGRWVPGTPMTDSQNVTDWSGVYVGGKLGGAWSDIDWSQDLNVFTAAGAADPATPVTFGPSGIAGGIFGGANLQMGNWIFGLEGSYSGSACRSPRPARFSRRPTPSRRTSTGWRPSSRASATRGTGLSCSSRAVGRAATPRSR